MPLLRRGSLALLAAAPDLGHGVTPLGRALGALAAARVLGAVAAIHALGGVGATRAPKKGNAKECSNYHTIALISHISKVMLKILQARLQQYVNRELPDVQAGFRKSRRIRDCKHLLNLRKSKRISEKHLLLLY